MVQQKSGLGQKMQQQEIARLRAEYHKDEERMKKRFETEVKMLEERFEKEIESERIYLESLIEVEIGKLKDDYDAKIDEINRNRYKNIGMEGGTAAAAGAAAADTGGEHSEAVMKAKKSLEEEMAREREEFARACRERRTRFETQMRMSVQGPDAKRVAFLKREIVPLVKAPGLIRITDESILETRYALKINRHAVRTGPSWALYRAQYQGKPVICRIGVLFKTPIEIRLSLDQSAKCARFACEKPATERFVRLHNIFATEQKIYVLMDEANPSSWLFMAYRNSTVARANLKKWLGQLCDAIGWLHLYSIAHLNVRLENIIFDESNELKLVGFSRAFCSFNLDQERFVLAKRCVIAPHNDHLPPEVFDGDFEPQLADMWSVGALIYEAETKHNPRKKFIKESKKLAKLQQSAQCADSPNQQQQRQQFEREFKRPPFTMMAKISNAHLRTLVTVLLDPMPYSRGRIEEVKQNDYFKAETSG